MPDVVTNTAEVEEALARRHAQFSINRRGEGKEPPAEAPIAESDKTLYGRPVRMEVDVCVPLADLRKLLIGIRADIADAILMLDRPGTPHDRRFAAYLKLCSARAKGYQLKKDLKLRGIAL
jgi:hypothetical protein